MPYEENDELLTSAEVAKQLKVQQGYVAYLRRTGQLIPVDQQTTMLRPRLLYRRSEVLAFKAKREQEIADDDKEAHLTTKSGRVA